MQGRLDLLIDRATRLDGEPLTRIARNTLKLAATPEEREKGFEQLRQAMEAGEPNAAFHLLRALERADADPETRRKLAERLAAQGKGIGLRSLVRLEDGGPEVRRAIWERYREVIEKNGDADAITFALPFVDEAAREDYLNRFRAALNCHVDESVTMAEALNALGQHEEAVHWLGVAEALAEEGWTYVLVADTYLEVGGEAAVEQALELLDRGRTAGHGPAAMRLLSLHRTEDNGISFDDRTLATFYVDLIEGKTERHGLGCVESA
ncbi:hypothetical protein QW131_30970 [Roseibium salinum]|nr:hypothetical protein [Roseibium salinum]